MEESSKTNVIEAVNKVLSSLINMKVKEADGVMDEILQLDFDFKMAVFNPILVSTFIPLPKSLTAKKYITNIQNNDHK